MKSYLVVYYIFMAISLVTGIINIKKKTSFLFLVLLIALSIITELGTEIFKEHNSNYYLLYHCYTPIEYGLLGFYFLKTIDNKKLKAFIVLSIALFTAFCIVISFVFGLFNDYPWSLTVIETILVLTCSFIALFEISPDLKYSIYQNSTFWFSTGLILYFSGTFLIDGIFNAVLTNNKFTTLKSYHVVFNSLFNYLLYTFFSIGFCVKK
jgi:hypothetical protein